MKRSNNPAQQHEEWVPCPIPGKSICPAESTRICAFLSAKSRSTPPSPSMARLQANESVRVYDCSGPWGDESFHGDVRTRPAPVAPRLDFAPRRCRGSRRSRHAAASRQAAARWSRNCTMPARESSRRRWSISPSAKTWGANWPPPTESGQEPAAFPASRPVLRRGDPRRNHPGICPRRGGARPGHHSLQHQPSGIGADDHRPQFPGQNQRQHRQLRRRLLHRGGSGENALGHPMGRRHRDGFVHRQEHPRHARMDSAQFARAHRHRARFIRRWKRSAARPRN